MQDEIDIQKEKTSQVLEAAENLENELEDHKLWKAELEEELTTIRANSVWAAELQTDQLKI